MMVPDRYNRHCALLYPYFQRSWVNSVETYIDALEVLLRSMKVVNGLTKQLCAPSMTDFSTDQKSESGTQERLQPRRLDARMQSELEPPILAQPYRIKLPGP